MKPIIQTRKGPVEVKKGMILNFGPPDGHDKKHHWKVVRVRPQNGKVTVINRATGQKGTIRFKFRTDDVPLQPEEPPVPQRNGVELEETREIENPERNVQS